MKHGLVAMLGLAVLITSCISRQPEGAPAASARPATLSPVAPGPSLEWKRRTAYVPVYSSIPWGFDAKLVDLAITLTIRNTSTRRSLVVWSVRYFDSSGQPVRAFVEQPVALAPMASADFVIQQRDTSGGRGASFRVETASEGPGDDSLIEAVMVGQTGNAGVSFTTGARPVE